MQPVCPKTVVRYLTFLAAACLIASLHVGPLAVLIWLVVALSLRPLLADSSDHRSRSSSHTDCERRSR